jgi:hypothetical protein
VTKATDRALKALRSPSLRWICAEIPKRYQDHPQVIAQMLGAAVAGNPRLADDPAYRQAAAALREVEVERQLEVGISKLYHDSKLRAAAGPSWDFYWSNPQVAREKLIELSATDPAAFKRLGGDEVLRTVVEAQEYAKAAGVDTTAPAAAPIPGDAAKADAEYQGLVKKSATERLSSGDYARMTALKEAQMAPEQFAPRGLVLPANATPAEASAHRKALGLPEPPPSEYQQLLQKHDRTQAEYARMIELKGQQLVAEGKATAEDLAAESGGPSGESDNE